MNNIKDYREKELKSYIIGNILLLLGYSGKLHDLITWGIDNSFNALEIIVESALLSSVLYIYVFIMDSIISGEMKFFICYLGVEKKPGYTIFTEMKRNLKDDRFSQDDVLDKYKEVYENMPEKNRKKYENVNWFRLYNGCKNESKVYTSHRDYLLCRDLCVSSVLIFIVYLILVFLFNVFCFSWRICVFFLIEVLVTNIAMRVKGTRFAYNVIAVDINDRESSDKE